MLTLQLPQPWAPLLLGLLGLLTLLDALFMEEGLLIIVVASTLSAGDWTSLTGRRGLPESSPIANHGLPTMFLYHEPAASLPHGDTIFDFQEEFLFGIFLADCGCLGRRCLGRWCLGRWCLLQ